MSEETSKEIYGSVLPYPVIKTITLESDSSGNVIMTPSVVIRDMVPSNSENPSLSSIKNEIKNFIKFAIICSTDSDETAGWIQTPGDLHNSLLAGLGLQGSAKPSPGIINWGKTLLNAFQGRQTGLKPITKGTGFNKYINNNGDRIIEYPIGLDHPNFGFENPQHLSCFVLAYIDFYAIKDKFELEDTELQSLLSSSSQYYEVSHLIVLNNGKVESLVNKFYKQDGTEWTGPVHKSATAGTPPGWLAGTDKGQGLPDSDSVIPLELAKVTQDIVRDFRSSGIDYNITEQAFDYKSHFDTIFSQLSTTSDLVSSFEGKQSVIYDKISYAEPEYDTNKGTLSSKCGVFFTIDMETILRRNSVLPGLYGEDSLLVNIAKIKNMTLNRNRVELVQGHNSVGSPVDKYKLLENISHDVIATFTDDNTVNNSGITEKTIFLNENQSSAHRHFDCEEEISSGVYSYFLEMEIEDPAMSYLSLNLLELHKLLIQLKRYYMEVTSTNATPSGKTVMKYDIYSKKFTDSFIKSKNNNDRGIDLTADGVIKTRINGSLKSLLIAFGNTDVDNFLTILKNMISPETGSPDTIDRAYKLIQSIVEKISNLAGVAGYNFIGSPLGAGATNQDIFDASSTTAHSKEPKLTFKIIIPLKSILEVNNDIDVGYDYLSTKNPPARGASPPPGIKKIDYSELLGRSKEESLKYFTNSGALTKIQLGPDTDMLDLLGPRMLSYFTPSKVRLGNYTLNSSPNIQNSNKEEYKTAILKCLEYNSKNKQHSIKDNILANTKVPLKTFGIKKLLIEAVAPMGLFLEEQDINLNPTTSPGVNDAPTDPDNAISSDEIDIGELTYNGEDIQLKSLKDPNALFMHLSGLGAANKNRQPLEYYDSSKLTVSQGAGTGTQSTEASQHPVIFDPSNMKYTDVHIHQEARIVAFSKLVAGDKIAAKTGNELKKLPNQIKSLLDSSLAASATAGINAHLFNGTEKDPKLYIYNYPVYWMHFENIVEVKYLAGYEKTNKVTHLQKPIWKTLDLFMFSTDDFKNKNILCRLKRYENKLADVKRPEMLELPIYNEYFILDTNKSDT
ncbi:MAG TPA: hypothetical protein EYN08_02085 [Gammaproteobacteria bacterium]|nr:hypothetical protein [Gammaproteobacteria bacterium]